MRCRVRLACVRVGVSRCDLINQRRVVIAAACLVEAPGHLPQAKAIISGWPEKLRTGRAAHPRLDIRLVEQHRHAVVNSSSERVGTRDDDGARHRGFAGPSSGLERRRNDAEPAKALTSLGVSYAASCIFAAVLPSVSQPPSSCAVTRTPDVVVSASRHLASVTKKGRGIGDRPALRAMMRRGRGGRTK